MVMLLKTCMSTHRMRASWRVEIEAGLALEVAALRP